MAALLLDAPVKADASKANELCSRLMKILNYQTDLMAANDGSVNMWSSIHLNDYTTYTEADKIAAVQEVVRAKRPTFMLKLKTEVVSIEYRVTGGKIVFFAPYAPYPFS